MDITYGDSEKKVYFGILIRSIRDMVTGEFFTGPCVSVNELLRNFVGPDPADIVKEWKGLEAFTEESETVISFVNRKFALIDATVPPLSIFVGPRVGLSEKYPDYQQREYRYAVDIKDIKKQKIFRQLV